MDSCRQHSITFKWDVTTASPTADDLGYPYSGMMANYQHGSTPGGDSGEDIFVHTFISRLRRSLDRRDRTSVRDRSSHHLRLDILR